MRKEVDVTIPPQGDWAARMVQLAKTAASTGLPSLATA